MSRLPWGRVALLLVALVGPGCSFDASYHSTTFACDTTAECRTGQTCIDGLCHGAVTADGGERGDSGGATSDSGITPDAPFGSQADAAITCDAPPAEEFTDTFTSLAAWDKVGTSMCDFEADGQLLISSGIDDCTLRSKGAYRLEGRTWIHVTEGDIGATFEIHLSGGRTYRFRRGSPTFLDLEVDAPAGSDTKTLASNHTWWAFRRDPTGWPIYFETSQDGIDWTAIPGIGEGSEIGKQNGCILYEVGIRNAASDVAFDLLNIAP